MTDIIHEIRTKWVTDRISTHYEQCYLSHPECAMHLLIDEIDHLRTQVAELLPYAFNDARCGLTIGPAPQDHPDDNCPDCVWYNESLLLMARIKQGEFGPLSSS